MTNSQIEEIFVKLGLNDYYDFLELENDNYLIDFKKKILCLFKENLSDKRQQFFRFMKNINPGTWHKLDVEVKRGTKKFDELYKLYFISG